MALDPGILAILQARRNYATRGPVPAGAQTDPQEPPEYGLPPSDPVAVPAPVAAPAPPEAKSLARASRMRNYMQANGMTPMTYGRFNVRRGNLPVGSGLPGGAAPGNGTGPGYPWSPANPTGAQAPAQGQVNATVPASGAPAPAPSGPLTPGGGFGEWNGRNLGQPGQLGGI